MAVPKIKEHNLTTFTIGKATCDMREPTFENLQFAMSAMTTQAGNMDMVGAGKALYETCVENCDPAIKDSAHNMMSLCIEIAKEYLVPVEVEIKKN